MAIAALLILAAIPQFGNYRAKAADSVVRDDARNLAVALESYRIDQPEYPRTLEALQEVSQPFTKHAYWQAGNAALLCTWGDRWGFVARSASGATWLTTSDGRSEPFTATFLTGNTREVVCPAVGQVIGATGRAFDNNGTWVHDRGEGKGGWMVNAK